MHTSSPYIPTTSTSDPMPSIASATSGGPSITAAPTRPSTMSATVAAAPSTQAASPMVGTWPDLGLVAPGLVCLACFCLSGLVVSGGGWTAPALTQTFWKMEKTSLGIRAKV